MCECCGGDCKLTKGIYTTKSKEPYIDFIRTWRRVLSGECERCGEHAVDCTCKFKHKADIRKLKLQIAKRAYQEIVSAIKRLEEHFLCNIQWDEYISVDGEGFGYFDLISKE